MKKILITGGSGFLGWHICHQAKQKWDVYSTYSTKPLHIPQTQVLPLDISEYSAVKQLFKDIQPDAVIHTAAQSQPNYCQTYPQESYKINVTAAANLAGICADNSIPYVFTSTDLVFNGLNAPYKETDSVSPVNIYGEQKVQAELEILTRYPQATICRMPLMFGAATPTATSFMQGFIQTLAAGKELNLFVDEFRTPVSGVTAAQGLLLAMETFKGIIHLGGKERISRYDFGKLMVEILQLPGANLKSCRQQDVKMAAPRPQDVSLDSSKAFSLGYQPLSIREELELIAKS
ncbi:SDR family oxidoreductase [Calothrix sp. 336/3]|uniref:SDR family oxidoreductase n=1 Tax=Calothrix sp. 336/3 TaxID=1337936 RepID=UPI0004E36BC1|nr:NAD(P)-dependent oxidoreductase [Calothrix sp. 336/3]AKG21041.1 dTDP-4-dehydrorhamnose reductase [Calothrix sp. 336/3]